MTTERDTPVYLITTTCVICFTCTLLDKVSLKLSLFSFHFDQLTLYQTASLINFSASLKSLPIELFNTSQTASIVLI